eukprot:1356011-Pyramimonas_sp.AAC.1
MTFLGLVPPDRVAVPRRRASLLRRRWQQGGDAAQAPGSGAPRGGRPPRREVAPLPEHPHSLRRRAQKWS